MNFELDRDREGLTTEPQPLSAPSPDHSSARDRFRGTLMLLPTERLQAITTRIGLSGRWTKPAALVEAILTYWDDQGDRLSQDGGLEPASRCLLGLLALTEQAEWPVEGAVLALAMLGCDAKAVLDDLELWGLVVRRVSFPETAALRVPVIHAHPVVVANGRVLLPSDPGPATVTSVRQIREADGLELILRLAALWQRLQDAPLRQTQQGTLYKRDRERLEDDPVLAGPIVDALEPLPDPVPLLQALALAIGLVVPAAGGERLDPASAEYWSDHAVHLPHMLATRWLGLRGWHELGGTQGEGAEATLALPFARPAVLLWLARATEGEWVALDDLAEHLHRLDPRWVRPILGAAGPAASPRSLLQGLLLGGAYQLGLVRAAEEDPTGRPVVQLTALGRYVLGVGPHPEPRPAFPHFLFVQPNFEVIAYRQGLNPGLIGRFSRFARWVQIGAALELRLTADSVYRGLEGGMTPDAMLERLSRHSARPLPAGVAEAVRTWASRRERVTYHATATLVEFAEPEALEDALREWPGEAAAAPSRIADRLLLVEDERTIPYTRFKLAGARDYRRPAEVCVEVEADGVTLLLDLGLSDLFVDAELSRFADEQPRVAAVEPKRRFLVSRSSLAKGAEDGLTPQALARWFEQRTGSVIPPAIRLLLHASAARPAPIRAIRPVVLQVPSTELLDGMLQHPATQPYLRERLGPTAVIVPHALLNSLRRALKHIGIPLVDESDPEAETSREDEEPRLGS